MEKTLLLRNRRKFLDAVAALPLVSTCRTADAQDRPADSARVDALAETVRLRYGNYLSESDMAEIRRGIERMLRSAETLAHVKITNFDAPDFLFHPDGSLNS